MNVVIGYQDTPEGRAAIEKAVSLAREADGSVHLVRCVALPKEEAGARDYEHARAVESARLEKFAATLASDGIDCRWHVPIGVKDPADAILSVAHEVGAELIVIGMRRRSRVGKLVLGSTAQAVLLRSNCDVLSVKAVSSGPSEND